MTHISVALNPVVADDSLHALVIIITNPPGNGTVRDCDSWAKLHSIADEFGVNARLISWDNDVLDWCVKYWGPAPE